MYLAGQRTFDWVKLKGDYYGTQAVSDIDLIIIGGYFGEGSKKIGEAGMTQKSMRG